MAYYYGFGPGPVIDPDTGELVASASLQVYAAAEGGDPLTVKVGGVEVTEVQAGNEGMLQQFFATVPRVYVEGDGISTRFLLTAYDDVIRRADDAAETALEASNSAAEAVSRAMQLKGNAAAGVSFWGTFSEGSAPGASDGVQVGDLGVLLP